MPFFAEPKTIYFCRQCENVTPTNQCPHCDPGSFPTPEELADEHGLAGRDMAKIELPSLGRAVVRISCPHCGDHAFSGANTVWHTKIYSTPTLAVFHCRQCDRFYRYSPIPPQTSNLRIGEQ